jgi:hypothetical protein
VVRRGHGRGRDGGGGGGLLLACNAPLAPPRDVLRARHPWRPAARLWRYGLLPRQDMHLHLDSTAAPAIKTRARI